MKTDDVAMLIRYVGNKDFEGARLTIKSMIANESGNVAERLKSAFRTWGDNNLKFFEMPQGLKEFVVHCGEVKKLSTICLSYEAKTSIDQFLFEHKHKEKFNESGISPRNRILLHGKPGNGKTILAGALSDSLGIPFININTSMLSDSYLGASARQINKLFDRLFEFGECLVFIDEVDSVSSKRLYDQGASVERSGALNNLLTRIDSLPKNIVLVCATNVVEELDPAFSRRFDLKINMSSPAVIEIWNYVLAYGERYGIKFEKPPESLEGKSWYEVEQFCVKAHREKIMNEIQKNSEVSNGDCEFDSEGCIW